MFYFFVTIKLVHYLLYLAFILTFLLLTLLIKLLKFSLKKYNTFKPLLPQKTFPQV